MLFFVKKALAKKNILFNPLFLQKKGRSPQKKVLDIVWYNEILHNK
jgi:hypothetical protein